jgi:pimeloyl-ACP methyl ester carboxylesterase
MGCSVGFWPTLKTTIRTRYVATTPIQVPTTVAFGTRDWLLRRRRSRRTEELPAGTRVRELPGCGHVPMDDDPQALATLIKEAVSGSGMAAPRGTHISS